MRNYSSSYCPESLTIEAVSLTYNTTIQCLVSFNFHAIDSSYSNVVTLTVQRGETINSLASNVAQYFYSAVVLRPSGISSHYVGENVNFRCFSNPPSGIQWLVNRAWLDVLSLTNVTVEFSILDFAYIPAEYNHTTIQCSTTAGHSNVATIILQGTSFCNHCTSR